MKSIALRPWELAAYMRHKKLLVVRPVKPQPLARETEFWCVPEGWFGVDPGSETRMATRGAYFQCPFGKPGEVLGIKEACRTGEALDRLNFAEIASSCLSAGYKGPWCPLKYEADGATKEKSELISFGGEWGKLRSAQHMPEWAVRHRPTIADIRVMRVQDITAPDAVAAEASEVLFRDANDPVRKAAFARGTFDCERWDQTAGAVDMFLARWEHEYPGLTWAWAMTLEGR